MADWGSAAAGIAVAALVVFVPGGVVGLALRLRGVPLLGLTPAITVAIVGTTAVACAPLGIPFGWGPVLIASVLAAVAAALVARLCSLEPRGQWDRRAALVGGAVLVSGAAIGVLAFGGVASPADVSQTYDGVFHLNAVSRILGTGDGSSFDLYRLTHPGTDVEYYPAGWHDLVALVAQLSGASVPVATTAVWLATAGLAFPAGVAFLAAALFPDTARRTVLPVAAALAASACAAAPYVLLAWGVLYPTGLAYALLPAGIALAALLARQTRRRDSLGLLAAAAVWLVAEVFAHPRSLPTAAVLLLPLLGAVVLRWARAALRDPLRRRRTAILLAGGAVLAVVAALGAALVVLRYFGVAARPVSDRLNGGPATAHQSLGESALQALLLAPPSGPAEASLAPAVAVAALTVVGLLYCLLRPGRRWIVVAYLLLGALYVLAAGTNSDFAKLATGLWYKDKFRLFAALGILAPALTGYAIARLTENVGAAATRSRALPRSAVAASVLTVALLALSWAGPTLGGMRDAVSRSYEVPAVKSGALLDTDEVALLRRLPDLTPAGAVIAGDPWNGSTLTWAIGERESLFPHLTGDWGDDRLLVAARLDQAATDPEVCAALDRLGVSYLFASDGLLWNGNPQAELYAAIDRAAGAPGFEQIARSGGSALYRITACKS